MQVHVPMKIQKLSPDVPTPSYAHPGDSGLDVCAMEDKTLFPGDRALISTGLKLSVPIGYETQVRPRSGHSHKTGMMIINSPGTLDYSYIGEVKISVFNPTQGIIQIKKFDKIAQLVVCPVICADIEEVQVLDNTERSTGGFGSSGLNAMTSLPS